MLFYFILFGKWGSSEKSLNNELEPYEQIEHMSGSKLETFLLEKLSVVGCSIDSVWVPMRPFMVLDGIFVSV